MAKENKRAPMFGPDFADSEGRGQDSVVVPLRGEKKGEIRDDVVVKWNHTKKDGSEDNLSVADHERRLLYKKKKYELLKLFLEDIIPDSSFALGEKMDGGKRRIKGYTIQKKVPDFKLSELTDEQLKDPRLIRNIHNLFTKLITMHRFVERINKQIPKTAQIDVRLDLGPISKLVTSNINSNKINIDVLDVNSLSSPNLLVDPNTMNLYCIDFGRGEWSDEKESTLLTIMTLAERELKN